MKKKGRNSDLVTMRNQALMARYYYWNILCERRHDKVLEMLSKREFFIAEATIMRQLLNNDVYLQELICNKVTVAKLELAFPTFNWKPDNRIIAAKEQLKLF
jgi:hypothetical protein